MLRRLRRFAIEEFAHEYPLCSRLISDFGNPWVLYIAALFHDIGKGPWRRPLGTRRNRRCPVLRRPRPRGGRKRTGRVAGSPAPVDVQKRPERGYLRPHSHSQVCRHHR
ncbi:MAG: hypothetical protein V5B30_16795 [Candidatus Accumulibacter delftensis]